MSEFEDLMKRKAVALKYDPQKNGAPVVVASGMGYLAERITETAMEAGVPVYEDDSLATILTRRSRRSCIRRSWISISIFLAMCRKGKRLALSWRRVSRRRRKWFRGGLDRRRLLRYNETGTRHI